MRKIVRHGYVLLASALVLGVLAITGAPGTAFASASISISPNAGYPGTQVTVSGSGFGGNEQVGIFMTCSGPPSWRSGILGVANTKGNGSFSGSGNNGSVTIRIPNGEPYPAGSCSIVAVGASGMAAQAPFKLQCHSITNSTCASMIIGKVGLRFSTGPALNGIVKGISIQQVQLTNAPQSTAPFKVVYLSKNHRALYSLPGKPLYRYTPATGSWSRVSHIQSSGIYATRGAQTTTSADHVASTPAKASPSGPNEMMAVLGLGALLLLAFGGFAALRVRKTS